MKKALLFLFFGLLALVSTNSYGQCTAWFYTNTGSNHQIMIPTTFVPTIDGVPISSGDLIGVFYDSLGTDACGGMMTYVSGVPAPIAAWGTETSTTNGFATGEAFKWKIQRCSDGVVVDAIATYDTSNPMFVNQGDWAPNGISGLASLSGATSKDVGVITKLSPNTGCGLSSTQTVSCEIKNFGLGALSDAFDVAFSLDSGMTWTTETYPNSSGMAASGIITYTFTATADLSVIDSTYQIMFKTILLNDDDITNDLFYDTVANMIPPVVSFTGLATSYCRYENAGNSLVGIPSGGTFSGCGVLPGTDFFATDFCPSSAQTYVDTAVICYEINDPVTGCAGIICDTTVLYDVPAVNFTGFPTGNQACKLDTVCLSGITSVPAATSQFNSSPPVNFLNDSCFVPLTAGSYVFTFEVNSIHGCYKMSNPKTLTVHTLPNVSFTGLGTAYCVDGIEDTLIGTPSGGIYQGPGISDSIFSPAQAGPSGMGYHTISYTYVDNNLCHKTASKLVQIKPLPVVSFTGLLSEYCINQDSTALVGSPSGGTFTEGSTVISSNYFNPEDLYSHTIKYTYTDTYTYIDTVIYCTDFTTNNTFVHPLPVVLLYDVNNPYDTLGNGAIETAYPEDVILQTNQTLPNYLWQDGATTQQYDVQDYGLYSLTVTDVHGCKNSDDIFVGVTDLKLAEIATPRDSCILGDDIRIKVKIENSGTRKFSATDNIPIWLQVNNGTVYSEIVTLDNNFDPGEVLYHEFMSNTFDFSAIGEYGVLVYIDYDGGGTSALLPDIISGNDTLDLMIVNAGYPQPDLGDNIETLAFDTVVLDAGAEFYTFLWNTGETDQMITPTNYGNFSVTVTDLYGCEGEDDISVVTNIEEYGNFGEIDVYPNPNNGNFTLDIQLENAEDFKVEILSIDGRAIYSVFFKNRKSVSEKIDITQFSKGVYLLHAQSERGSSLKKLIIE